MKGKSHILLGHYLAERYLINSSNICIKAFLLGCIQPDRNPATYLKGSIHNQWLRGHNWGNSQRYMKRVTYRLEKRTKFRFTDYYALGKLIHYTADAFTFSHNAQFKAPLKEHNAYEKRLQNFFLKNAPYLPHIPVISNGSMMDTILYQHKQYNCTPRTIFTDTFFSIFVCSCLLEMLFPSMELPSTA